jgi:hypothetical protein
MFFRISSPIINKQRYNFWILRGATLAIATYRVTPANKKLNDYLWKEFGLNIKAACSMMVANCKVQKNQSNEIIITFPAKKIDRLASIITYGTGKIQGCSILQDAFGRH